MIAPGGVAATKTVAEGASPFQVAAGAGQPAGRSGQAAAHSLSLNRPPALSASSEGGSPLKHSAAGSAGRAASSSLNGGSDSGADDSSQEEVRLAFSMHIPAAPC
jgi:hypothetical protein